jgi:DNA integrity scanning protein DisA with diadenylate cyclase activity
LNDFIVKIKATYENDIKNYPYPIKKEIIFKEKNIFYTLRKFIVKNLQYELYDEVDFSNLKFDYFGCKILSELIKKCENIYLLKLNNCFFPEKGLQEILNSLNTFDDFYTLELFNVKLTKNNLKHIAHIKNESKKKKIEYDACQNQNNQTKVLNKTMKKLNDFTFK